MKPILWLDGIGTLALIGLMIALTSVKQPAPRWIGWALATVMVVIALVNVFHWY